MKDDLRVSSIKQPSNRCFVSVIIQEFGIRTPLESRNL